MSTSSLAPESPSEVLALCFLLRGEGLTDIFHRLKELFDDPRKIPQLGVIGREYYPHSYASGVCDWSVWNLRTSGGLHDAIRDAFSRLADDDGSLHLPQCEGAVGHLATEEANQSGTKVSPAVPGNDAVRQKAEALLRELARERDRQRLLISLEKTQDLVSTGKLSPEGAVESLWKDLGQLRGAAVFSDWSAKVLDAQKQLASTASRGVELKTGLADLDARYVFRRNNLLVVGAPTSHGKTAFNIRCVTIPALKAGLKVVYVCFEDFSVFPLKFASAMYDVPLQHFTRYELATKDQQSEADAALEMSKDYSKKLILLPDTTMADLEPIIQRESPDVLVLDYLQKYVEAFYDEASKREACGRTTSRFQDLARKYGCYAVLSSQVRRRELAKINKETMTGSLRRPGLSDLKESGDIENYADSVVLLWWPWRDLSEDQSVSYDKGRYLIQIAKDKLGPGGDFECRFSGETLLFKDKYSVSN